jgi:riboflavin kinase/FMN adenylyltransferase
LKVYHSVEELPVINNPVLTLGTFDGVHLGHQKLINFLNDSAQRVNGESVLFTFHPHPRIVLHPDDHNLELIQTIDKRIEKLEKAGIDHLILFPFTKEFSRISATEFVRNILVNKLNIKILTIGYNHHFGRNREGNLSLLNELAPLYNFEIEEIPAQREGEISISSTKIRHAISDGNITKANQYMGHAFSFSGKVEHGDKIGSTIEFPTANITEIVDTQLMPPNGVYAVRVSHNGRVFDGMMNIGNRPTVSTDNTDRRIEVNIFDFNEDIYHNEIEVFVINRVRNEESFKSIEDLKSQLIKDETNCKNILARDTVSM